LSTWRSATSSGSPKRQRPDHFPAFARFSAWRRYHVRRDISSWSQGFLASMVRARSSIRGRPVRRFTMRLFARLGVEQYRWSPVGSFITFIVIPQVSRVPRKATCQPQGRRGRK
jgi:hypothetical protein